PSANPKKELLPAQPSAQESKPAQQKTQTAKSEESKATKGNGEEGTDKEGAGKKAVTSLILTVKLALLEDPLLFPYEIEVDAGSDEVALEGNVSSERVKAAAATRVSKLA